MDSVPDKSGTERIDGWDDHGYWIVDFGEMKAWSWTEHRNDEWTSAEYPIRRENGKWEMFLDEAKWTELVEAEREGVRRMQAAAPLLSRPGNSAERWAQEENLRQLAEVKSELAEHEKRTSGWLEFEDDTAEELESRWAVRSSG